MITARPATRTKTTPRHVRPLQDRRGANGAADVRHAPTEHGGDRRSRRLERRRRIREEIMVAAVLAVILIITVVLLALQWLNSTVAVLSAPLANLVLAPGGLT